MDLREYLRLLRRRWKLIVATVIVVVGAATALTFSTAKTYQASTEVFVSLRDGDSGSVGAYQGNLFTQDRVKSYAQIVDSPAVTTPVIEKLGLASTPDKLGTQITATVPTGTVLVDIAVTDRVPAVARNVANATAAQFGLVVRNLERGGTTTSPVTVTVVRPASLPTSPVSPRPVLNLAFGLVLGLALGVGLAFVRDALDTTLKSVEDLNQLIDAPSLGEIGYDSRAPAHPLILDDGQHSARAEAFRTIRTNLRFVDVDRPPQVVVVTGPLQAEGKSTTACNLALTLAIAGVSVILLEGDLRRPRVSDYLGIEGAAGLTDVLVGRHRLDHVLQQWGDLPLQVLPSGPVPPNPSELLGSSQMHRVLGELRGLADIVVIDAPPLLPVTDAAVLARESDGAILVVRFGRTSKDQVSRAAAALRAVNARVLGTVFTMVPARGPHGHGYGHSYYGYGDAVPTLTAVPEPAPKPAAKATPPHQNNRQNTRRRAKRRAG